MAESPRQIYQERKAWARDRVLVAWLKLSRGAEDPALIRQRLAELERDLEEAKAIASEWGVAWAPIVEELEARA